MKIDRLTVENYRGATSRLELKLDSTKPLAMIFGENGTGKSTIVDALDAVGNCAKGSIGQKSSTRPRDHLPAIGKTVLDVRIELWSGAECWETTLAGDTLTTVPEPRPKIRVLRRADLQKLIESTPATRYEELSKFIDVEGVKKGEDALRTAAREVNAELDTEIRRRADAESQLQEIWDAEGNPGESATEWAKLIAESDDASQDEAAKVLVDFDRKLVIGEAALERYRNAIARLDSAVESNSAIALEAADLPGVDPQQAIKLAAVLEGATNFLAEGEHDDNCPVCRQDISIEVLKSDLAARSDELIAYDEYRVRKSASDGELTGAKQELLTCQVGLVFVAKELVEVISSHVIEPLQGAGIVAADYPLLTRQSDGDEESVRAEATQLVAALIEEHDSLDDAERSAAASSTAVNAIGVLYEQLQESIASTNELDALSNKLDAAFEIVKAERIAFTQGILDDIASECNSLYAGLHPGESIALSELSLDPNRRASLNQSAEFHSHTNVPPQAYFSESHLDTLGFCFWLALVKRENPDADATLVIDDVFTSVDSQHITRIAQLLTDERENFEQIFITTHQRLWRDIYRNPHGAGKLAHLIELQNWSLNKGISNYQTKLAVDELVSDITSAPFDRQRVASKAGILLEAVLDLLALSYRCRVPRTPDGRYALGELLDGTAKLFKALEIHRPMLDALGEPAEPPEYQPSQAKDCIDQLRIITFVRNQVGAHFNVDGAEISDSDVQNFAQLAVDLATTVSCPVCGQVPAKQESSHFACSCPAPKECRMTPLQL